MMGWQIYRQCGRSITVSVREALTANPVLGKYSYERGFKLDTRDFSSKLSKECIVEILRIPGIQTIHIGQYDFRIIRNYENEESPELLAKACRTIVEQVASILDRHIKR